MVLTNRREATSANVKSDHSSSGLFLVFRYKLDCMEAMFYTIWVILCMLLVVCKSNRYNKTLVDVFLVVRHASYNQLLLVHGVIYMFAAIYSSILFSPLNV